MEDRLRRIFRTPGDARSVVEGICCIRPQSESLMRLPRGTKVGLSCVNQRSTESFFKEIIFSGGSSLAKMWAGQDSIDGLRKRVDEYQVILAANFVYDGIASMAGPGKRVTKVDPGLVLHFRNTVTSETSPRQRARHTLGATAGLSGSASGKHCQQASSGT